MAIDTLNINLVDKDGLNQLSRDTTPDMSNNLNIASSLETYKKTCEEKHLGLPFELNISRHRRRPTGDDLLSLSSNKASNIPQSSTPLENNSKKNSAHKRLAKSQKITTALLCFLGWIVFFPCCCVGFLMREPPESTDDLNSDPCWPCALLNNSHHDDDVR